MNSHRPRKKSREFFQPQHWTSEKAAELYGINRWGAGYFSLDDGEVVVTPYGNNDGPKVSLPEIVKAAEERGLQMPVLLRFENILGSQIKLLNETFRKVIAESDYKGEFKGVFPIKVNQQEEVIEAISQFGKQYSHGLEAGSKAELIAAISMMKSREACLICNGYKDSEFIDLGLYAVKMGYPVFFVIEVPGEVDLIIERSKLLGVKPHLGIRIKLSTQAEGQWSESGGDNSVFGLGVSHTVSVIDRLKAENMLECLELLHYHIGSQIPNISDIRAGVIEACRIYEELVHEGAPMGYLDLGGGLAVDYDGSRSNYHSSRNYSIEEYCRDIVESIIGVLSKSGTPHPIIITESGRAVVAYYSMLIFNILDVAKFNPPAISELKTVSTSGIPENLRDVNRSLSEKTLQECLNDALFYRTQARQLFKHGQIGLRERALAEDMVQKTLQRISEFSKTMDEIPKGLESLNRLICDIYYGNLSLFQSLPDVWAIKQILPVMPIHRLDEAPTRPAIISDITCDCDGKLDSFPEYSHEKNRIMLHELKDCEEYYVGVFLVGAYQETLGDLHNLFGDTNVISIRVNEDGSYKFLREIDGDSVSEVLSFVEYDVTNLRRRLRQIAEDSIQKGFITAPERKTILSSFEAGLRGYTYFEKNN